MAARRSFECCLAEIEARFPPKLEFLFRPSRYKVAWGGRGGSKSWGYARALLIQAAQRKLRILCTREVQKSIKDSVHQLLSDQIASLGLGSAYEILQTEIRGRNGSNIVFSGLADQTVESIKSFEGVDIVWVEEARAVSKRSWSILIPTIRKDGSEIWVSFNPELDIDETYMRFVLNPPPDAVVVKIGYQDNPWFPSVLEKERLYSQANDPDEYDNIWEGKCRRAVLGAVYGREIEDMHEQGRCARVPYDPLLKVHTIWDLGWADAMAIIFAQRRASELRVIDYIEDSHKRLDEYVDMLNERKYNYGTDYIPHDGAARDIKTGKSTQEALAAMKRKVVVVPRGDIEEGIKAARLAFPRTYFDKDKAAPLIDHLKRYRRHISAATATPGSPMHDEHSHGADAFRNLAMIADQMTNSDQKPVNTSMYLPSGGFGIGA